MKKDKRLIIRLDEALFAKIKKLKEKSGIPISYFVRDSIERRLPDFKRYFNGD